MKLYLAGVFTANFHKGGTSWNKLSDREKEHHAEIRYMLESYHYINNPKYVKNIRNNGKKVFLDSGAFSAFTQGVKVDLVKYCNYIKDNQDILECASVLDSIGDPQGTYDNQIAMEKQGVSPLPCFHYGEDPRWLEFYLSNYEYITIGGMVPISTPQLRIWLDRIWEKHLTDGAGRARAKVHGFGLTTLSLMERYPWYSVDSSSWVQISSNGNILLPDSGRSIAISENSPARKQAGKHFDNLPEPEQAVLREKIEALGFTIDDLHKKYESRWLFNIAAYRIINDRHIKDELIYKPDSYSLF